MPQHELVVSFGSFHQAEIVRVEKLSWQKFSSFLSKDPPKSNDKAAHGWYIPAEFDPPWRDSDNFIARHALTFDYDRIEPGDVKPILRAFKQFTFCAYTTASHTPTAPRIRVVMPASRTMGFDEFQAVSRRVASAYDIEKIAKESFPPAQMMYCPTTTGEHQFLKWVNSANLIDVDEILATYEDWTDRSTWPRQEKEYLGTLTAQTPPDKKQGVIGLFCRTFSVPEAIEKYELPYEKTSDSNRFTYAHGSRPEGAVIYDGGLKLHSHHDSDPAAGQHNAFDLVRLHRFGAQDEGHHELSVTERPSYRAMCALVHSETACRAAEAAEEFEDVQLTNGLERSGTLDWMDPPPGERKEKFRIIPAPEFASSEPPAYLIKGVLPQAELGVIYGESTAGKSFTALDMAAAVTRGVPWRKRKTKRGRAVYICAEGAEGFRLRMSAYALAHGCALDELPGVIADVPDLRDTAEAAVIAKRLSDYGPLDLVIVDTLAASSPGADENTAKDMGLIINHCKFFHRKTGALILLIHHSGKDPTKGARGWSGLRAAADVEIEIVRNGDYRAINASKLKDGADGSEWSFKLVPVVLGLDEDGDDITSCVVEHTDAPASDAPRGMQPAGKLQRQMFKMARDMLNDEPFIEALHLCEKLVELMPAPSGRDTRFQRVESALTQLTLAGFLYTHGKNQELLSLSRAIEDDTAWLD